jgi:hypothetical protein
VEHVAIPGAKGAFFNFVFRRGESSIEEADPPGLVSQALVKI